jgi:hypothetical protein
MKKKVERINQKIVSKRGNRVRCAALLELEPEKSPRGYKFLKDLVFIEKNYVHVWVDEKQTPINL